MVSLLLIGVVWQSLLALVVELPSMATMLRMRRLEEGSLSNRRKTRHRLTLTILHWHWCKEGSKIKWLAFISFLAKSAALKWHVLEIRHHLLLML